MNLNFCKSGGMNEVLSLALGFPSDEVRRAACFLVTSVCAGNKSVQEFTVKLGGLNLIEKFLKEKGIRNQEAVFGALSSIIKGEYFEGKRRFIMEFNGLDFLTKLMNEDIAKHFLRLYKKVLLLANDLVTNDDYILKENPFFVRQYFANSKQILGQLLQSLQSDPADVKFVDVIAQALRILFRIHQVKPDGQLIQALEHHKTNIINAIENVDENL